MLVIMTIGVGFMFSGCVTALQDKLQGVANAIDRPFKPLANALKKLNGNMVDPNNETKSTDNLEPWNIKKSDDTHYTLDVFYALPNAKTLEEANKEIADALNSGVVRVDFIATGEARNKKFSPLRGGCKTYWNKIEGTGVNSIFYIYEVRPSCGYGGAIRYIQFKALKLGDTYYMVVKKTNAKNASLLGSFRDAFLQVSQPGYTPKGFVYPDYNMDLSWLLTALINRRKSKDFVDIQLDSKDPRAEQYRELYTDYFKKEMR